MTKDECWVIRYQEVIVFVKKELPCHFFVFLSRFICLYSICLSTLTKNRKYLCKIVSFLLYHSLDFDKNCLNNARNNKQMPYFR